VRPNKAKKVAGNHWEVFGFAHQGSRRAVAAKLLVQVSSEVIGDGKDKLPVKLLACADRGCRLGVSEGCRPSQLSQGEAGGRRPSGFSLLLIMLCFCCQFLYIIKGYIYPLGGFIKPQQSEMKTHGRNILYIRCTILISLIHKKFLRRLNLTGDHATGVRHLGLPNPLITQKESPCSKLQHLCACDVLLHSRPIHTPRHVSARACVLELGVEASVQREIPHPRQPPFRLDQVIDVGLHDYGPQERLPWTTQICPALESHREECKVRHDVTTL
jgi:hypothetical protein